MSYENEVCELIDKLTLDTLDLMEQYVQSKINIERVLNEGQLLSARARYVQGNNTVTSSQLPTENGPEFRAISQTTTKTESDLGNKQLTLKTNPIDKKAGFFDPLKWFGVLVPQSLHFAKQKYEKSVELVVESTNLQLRINTELAYIEKLKEIKKGFKSD